MERILARSHTDQNKKEKGLSEENTNRSFSFFQIERLKAAISGSFFCFDSLFG
jgi:hypothetical protein